jgi:hypothetical protein
MTQPRSSYPCWQSFLTWNMSVPDDVLESIVRPQAKQAALDVSLAILDDLVATMAPHPRCWRYQLIELEFMVRRHAGSCCVFACVCVAWCMSSPLHTEVTWSCDVPTTATSHR